MIRLTMDPEVPLLGYPPFKPLRPQGDTLAPVPMAQDTLQRPIGPLAQAGAGATADGVELRPHEPPESDLLARVAAACREATLKFHRVARACWRTAWHGAKLAGGSNGLEAKASKQLRGKSLSALSTAEAEGALLPGMIVYICKKPGSDPRSRNMKNKPHWMTFVGRDAGGGLRFSDQYSSDMTLNDVIKRYGSSRKIDTVFDPHASQRLAQKASKP